MDLSSGRRVNQEQKRINVDFPACESLDREAARIGVTRQSIIKVWLVERVFRQNLLTSHLMMRSPSSTSFSWALKWLNADIKITQPDGQLGK
ncbi:hypothetical protein HORIV_31250 [Vreelandella olivaria]|uniref:CopG family transcriptional regulator n=1 Tax=Vreelandella olivaria TaxID=390919 RepID=A0ABM7GFA7_9GAMM|nr:hypothetical protein HORIV_31250 [Halomonas olivaria]